MSQITKNQHYVPKFYLKRFADKSGNLQIFDLKNRRLSKNRHYSSICYENFFYGIRTGIFDEISQNFEKMFQEYEDKFSNKWESIITNATQEKITLDEFHILSWFLSTQMLRTKKFREQLFLNMENIEKTVFLKELEFTDFEDESIFKELENDVGESFTKEDYQEAIELLKQGNFKINYNNYDHLDFINRSLNGIKNLFFWQQWTFIKSSKNWNFITTDNPVVEWMPKRTGFYGSSFIERKHYLSITPRILIELKLNSATQDTLPVNTVKYIQASDEEVIMYNFLLSDFAHSYAYSKNKSEFNEMSRQIDEKGNSFFLYLKNYQ